MYQDRLSSKARPSEKFAELHSFLRLLLLVALACIIAAGALFSTRLDENEQTDAVHNLIKVTYILGLGAYPSPVPNAYRCPSGS